MPDHKEKASDRVRGRFRDDSATGTGIAVMSWIIFSTFTGGIAGLVARLYPDSTDIPRLPYYFVATIAYFGWICWRFRQFLVDGRDMPWWLK